MVPLYMVHLFVTYKLQHFEIAFFAYPSLLESWGQIAGSTMMHIIPKAERVKLLGLEPLIF